MSVGVAGDACTTCGTIAMELVLKSPPSVAAAGVALVVFFEKLLDIIPFGVGLILSMLIDPCFLPSLVASLSEPDKRRLDSSSSAPSLPSSPATSKSHCIHIRPRRAFVAISWFHRSGVHFCRWVFHSSVCVLPMGMVVECLHDASHTWTHGEPPQIVASGYR